MITNDEIITHLDRIGWSQRDLAKHISLDPDKVNKSIKGVRKWQAAELEAIRRAFGLSDVPIKSAVAALDVVLDFQKDGVELDTLTFRSLFVHLLTEFRSADEITSHGNDAVRSIINFQKSKNIL